MSTPILNATENPLTFNRFYKNNPKSNLKSSWVPLLCVIFYISVFYAFNLSPTLLSTKKFWFFVSNTLIFIVVVDFGAFSSSKQHNPYVEYTVNPCPTIVPSFQTEYKIIVEETWHHKLEAEDTECENIIDMVEPCSAGNYLPNRSHREEAAIETQEKIIEMIIPDPDHLRNQKTPKEFKKGKVEIIGTNSEADHHHRSLGRVKKKKPNCARSKSAIIPANEEKVLMQRTLSERHHEETPLQENNEFSNLSNEELNNRVEDFIQKFNREIRLQAARERIQSQAESCLEYRPVSCSLGYYKEFQHTSTF